MNFEQMRTVNTEFDAVPFAQGLKGDDWNPATLDMMGILNGANCNSYATAKLQALYKLGWPITALRLMLCNHPSQAARPNGNHLVLLADLDGETYVLCNTLAEPTLMERVPYQWVKVQVAGTPNWEFA